MLVSACVLPHPPVLVPEVGGRRARTGWSSCARLCLDAVARVPGAPTRSIVVVVGSADTRRPVGSQRPAATHGARTGSTSASAEPDVELPLALTIGAYLLDEAGWTGERELRRRRRVAARRTSARHWVARWWRRGGPRLLVMGDGSPSGPRRRRAISTTAPGAFDAAVVEALAAADAAALAALDPQLADELWVAGLPAWQVLAGPCDAMLPRRVVRLRRRADRGRLLRRRRRSSR